MSASPVFSSAATGRPFIFPPRSSPGFPPASPPASSPISTPVFTSIEKTAEILAHLRALPKLAAAVVPASRLDVCPAPEMVPIGIPQLDALTGGIARGCLTEICGSASSGRTSVLLLALARATQRGEVCALVDASDAFDPASAAAAGIELSRLLWIRCCAKLSNSTHRQDSHQGMPSGTPQAAQNKFAFSRWQSQLAQLLKVTDLLLQSNGFGMIALDLGDIPSQSARRIPLASWFRFRRAIEHTPTALLVLEQQPIAGSCSSTLLRVSGSTKELSAVSPRLSASHPPHSNLLDQFEITAELLCSRLERKLERKPAQSTASFTSRAAWAG